MASPDFLEGLDGIARSANKLPFIAFSIPFAPRLPSSLYQRQRHVCPPAHIRMSATVETIDVPVSSKGSLSVSIHGSSDATHTAILVHDFMTDKRLFNKLTAEPALRNCRLITLDMRGFGKSSFPTGAYSHVDDVKSVLDATAGNFGPVNLVGTGLGGSVALDFALDYPAFVESVAVIGSGLPGHSWSSETSFMDITAGRRIGRLLGAGLSNPEYVGEDVRDVVKWKRSFISTNRTWSDVLKSTDTDVAKQLLSMARAYKGFHFFQTDPMEVALLDRPPLIDRLDAVSHPVLVMVGENDTPDFEKIAREISNGVDNCFEDIVVLDGAGHFAVLETPFAIAGRLIEFWDRSETT